MEAHHQNSNTNNQYKFRNQDIIMMSERPHTSNGEFRNSNGAGIKGINSNIINEQNDPITASRTHQKSIED